MQLLTFYTKIVRDVLIREILSCHNVANDFTICTDGNIKKDRLR